MQNVSEEKYPGMLGEVKAVKDEAMGYAQVGGNTGDSDSPEPALPAGHQDAAPEAVPAPEAELSLAEKTPPAPAPAEEVREKIRIGDQEFETQAEALRYAEKLQQEQLLAEAHALGIREALQAQQAQMPAKQEEDNFEERYYSNPKQVLGEIQQKARDEAVAIIKQEQERERLWTQFLSENPSIRRKDAERVLNENWSTFEKMTDLPKAMKILAQKVNQEYEEIRDLGKPRVELPRKGAPVQSAGVSAPSSVTPQKKEDRVLTMSEQLRQLKR